MITIRLPEAMKKSLSRLARENYYLHILTRMECIESGEDKAIPCGELVKKYMGDMNLKKWGVKFSPEFEKEWDKIDPSIQ